MSNFKSVLFATIAGLALASGIGSRANAQTPLEPFTVNPNTMPGISGYSTFSADDIRDSTSALIQLTSPTTVSENGWLEFSSFNSGSTALSSFQTGLSTPLTVLPTGTSPGQSGDVYGLYATFSSMSTLSAPLNTPQVDTVTAFTYTVFADVGNNDTFNPAVASPATVATVTGTTGDQVVAFGVLISGQDGFTTNLGQPVPFLNVNVSFAVCTGTGTAKLGNTVLTGAAAAPCAGDTDNINFLNYFVSPVPFYQIAFAEANVTGDTISGTNVALGPTGATTSVTFLPVPEPASLLLFGAGLLGLGLGVRRRNKRAS